MVLKTLVAWKENMAASPKRAELTPFFRRQHKLLKTEAPWIQDMAVYSDQELTPQEQDELFSGSAARAPYAANIALTFTAQNPYFQVTGELWGWDEVKKELAAGESYTLTNCATGESCQMVFQDGENHAHMTPANPATDGQMLKKWLGESNSYYKIAVTVETGEKRVAASMQYDNATAHVYFQGSTSDVLNMADVEHDSLVKRAAGR